MTSSGYSTYSRPPNNLPYVVQEKYGRRHHHAPWFLHLTLPIPGVHTRRLRIVYPNLRRLHSSAVARFGRRLGSAILFFGFLLFVFVAFAFAKRFGTRSKKWPRPFIGDPSTLVFERDDLQRIWYWEISSGHYPSRRPIPEEIGFRAVPRNPAIPTKRTVSRGPLGFANSTRGVGPNRTYLEMNHKSGNTVYPPRPMPGSVADLDIIMDHCDFSKKKYVRDCLEVLRVGGGLDTGNRLRRGPLDDWKYIYIEDADIGKPIPAYEPVSSHLNPRVDGNAAQKNLGMSNMEKPPIVLPPPLQHRPYATLSDPCDPDNPRLFHMFWTGPFTDKPYTALLSFLYTQNTGLHLQTPDDSICRPQFWMWINPGPAAAVPNPSALHDMYSELKRNPWAAPFLHPRFKGVISFKLWNTTEQLDGVPELKDEWRKRDLFNSGGNVFAVPQQDTNEEEGIVNKADSDDLLNRAGSKSSSTYDRMSVILSDMARFVLCHRFGGTYLDADTIFLRDWEELWGWKGAFAYRWSRLPRYNTAVLHMNKNSALGTFLFRTALKNDLDFHPMTISRYTQDAHLEELLLRLPDALFDSAWLNTENYQRDRPPQPYFTDFAHFFETPKVNSAAPQAMGIDGFFKGAYSYHFHNFWWKPFDPQRNWPDLGERFIAGERQVRNINGTSSVPLPDRGDLDWATVLKRTFEAYIRGERPNMYGEWLQW